MMDRWTKEDVLDALQHIKDKDPITIYYQIGVDQPYQELEIYAIGLTNTPGPPTGIDIFVRKGK
tara:strand:+ start:229 stop:420 length:192 start_codon:yes stop_codon:yes gene_type:complete